MKIVCIILCLPFLGFSLTGYGRICSPCLLSRMIHEQIPGHDDGEEEHDPNHFHSCATSLGLSRIDAAPVTGKFFQKKNTSSNLQTTQDRLPGTGGLLRSPWCGLLLERRFDSSPPPTGFHLFILHSQLLI